MARTRKTEDPIITVKLQKGLADRNRLPLGDFLTVLEEFRQMIGAIGRRLQRERGSAHPDGDFGLEIMAGDDGNGVLPGSIWSPLAITANADIGILATQEVIASLNQLESEEGIIDPDHTLDKDLIRRISRVARIQKRSKLELEISIQSPGLAEPLTATFGAAGVASIKALQSSTFEVAGVSLYGKLTELLDRDPEEESTKGFWGELLTGSGEVWRVQFRPRDVDLVAPLFRKQVAITGTAVYFRVANPKILPETITADSDRDFVAAFDELVGCYKDSITPEMITAFRDGE